MFLRFEKNLKPSRANFFSLKKNSKNSFDRKKKERGKHAAHARRDYVRHEDERDTIIPVNRK